MKLDDNGDAMHLEIAFDERVLKRYSQRRSPLLVEIYWVDGDFCFPAVHWTDFGEVILGWWLRDALKLLEGSSSTASFRFMDGPFELRAVRMGNTLSVTFVEDQHGQGTTCTVGEDQHMLTMTVNDLVDALTTAGEKVRSTLSSLGLRSADSNGLSFELDGLKRARG